MHISTEAFGSYHEADHPKMYQKSMERYSKFFRFLWEVDAIGLERVPREGAGILAFSHRSYTEIFLQALIAQRPIRSMMKKEVKSYPFFGKYVANRGVYFVDRDGSDKSDRSAVLREGQSYIRQGRLLDMNPESTSTNRGPELGKLLEGTAALAVRAADEGIDCPIVPVGVASEHLWRRVGGRIPVVVGTPFYPELDGRSLKAARKETHQKLERDLQFVFDLANAIK